MSTQSPPPSKEVAADRGPSKGREVEKSRDRSESRRSKERSKSRDRRKRSRSRSRRRRSRSRSRDRERHRDRDRRRYSRSRSRDRYVRRPRDNDRPQRPPRRDRSRDRGRRGAGGGGGGSVEDELAKLDRTMRTVQAYNLNLRAQERDIFEFFAQAGPLTDIKVIRDKTTGRSKGFAYVEFKNKETVVAALSLTGQPLLGQPVMVKMSEAEKNLAWEAAQAAKKQQAMADAAITAGGAFAGMGGMISGPGLGPCRLVLSNLDRSITEADLRPIFDSFGPIDFVTLQRDGMGASQGTALVQFKLTADATTAQQQLAGVEFGGMQMHIQLAPLDYNPAAAGQAMAPGGGMLQPGGLPGPAVMVEERLDTDADDGGGMKLSAQSRVALMSRLAANAGIEVPQLPASFGGAAVLPPAAAALVPPELAMQQGMLGPASPIPTQSLLLKNMFDPEEETDPSWAEDIGSEVQSECSNFGPVEFVHVDQSSKGFVYVKFGNVQAASAAQKALHGRWFAGKQVCADFQFTPLFNAHFKL